MTWMKSLLLLTLPISLSVAAMPIKTQMLKPRAYFVEAGGNLLEALDLKSKTLKFSKKDSDLCGTALVRKAQTLTYSCTLDIPSTAKVSRIQNLVTPKTVAVSFGGSKREVQVQVTEDARKLILTTTFDQTGIDFDVSKFNDDFFNVYNKVALLVLTDAMNKQPVRIEVLESR